jgi:hypothetical protein
MSTVQEPVRRRSPRNIGDRSREAEGAEESSLPPGPTSEAAPASGPAWWSTCGAARRTAVPTAPKAIRKLTSTRLGRQAGVAWHLSMLLALIHAASGELSAGRMPQAAVEAALLETVLGAIKGR